MVKVAECSINPSFIPSLATSTIGTLAESRSGRHPHFKSELESDIIHRATDNRIGRTKSQRSSKTVFVVHVSLQGAMNRYSGLLKAGGAVIKAANEITIASRSFP